MLLCVILQKSSPPPLFCGLRQIRISEAAEKVIFWIAFSFLGVMGWGGWGWGGNVLSDWYRRALLVYRARLRYIF